MRFVLIALLATSMLPLSGCGTVGMLASKSEGFELADSLVLRTKPGDFVAATEAAGQSVGYRVSGVDRAKSQVIFTNNSSMAIGVLIGKMKMFRMEVTLGGDGRTVAIMVYASGNFGSADREKLEKQMADFKAALAQRLGGAR